MKGILLNDQWEINFLLKFFISSRFFLLFSLVRSHWIFAVNRYKVIQIYRALLLSSYTHITLLSISQFYPYNFNYQTTTSYFHSASFNHFPLSISYAFQTLNSIFYVLLSNKLLQLSILQWCFCLFPLAPYSLPLLALTEISQLKAYLFFPTRNFNFPLNP